MGKTNFKVKNGLDIGNNTFVGTISPSAITAARTYTLPDVSGTFVTTGDTGTVTSTMILDGTIVNADINASAAIADTKLATISTAGKVANTATTATSANTANAIVARDASGNFTAGAISGTSFNSITALSSTTPLMNGTAAIGTSTTVARADHVHPSDTTKANLASPVFTGDPTAPTAPQFDNDTSLATTAFVQRALGNSQGGMIITAATTLTAADAGKTIHLSGNTTYTVTLPSPQAVSKPMTFTFINTSDAIANIVTPTGLLIIGVSAPASIKMTGGDTLTLVSHDLSSWYAVGGSASLRTKSTALGSDFGSILSGNGFQKLPSGLIIQWGQIYFSTPYSFVNVTYPIAFPGTIDPRVILQGITGGTTNPNLWHGTPTNTSCPVSGDNACYVDYIAIGY